MKKNVWLIVVGIAVALLILVAAYYYQQGSKSPNSNIGGGRPVDGPIVLPPSNGGGACKNLCGDGQCQEIVCLALGCPCAETSQSCPQDCR